MAILRVKDITEMDAEALSKKTAELKRELNSEMGLIASGGRAVNAGRIREIRRTIARINTLASSKSKLGGKKQDKVSSAKAGKR